jgi:hypothetical protein
MHTHTCIVYIYICMCEHEHEHTCSIMHPVNLCVCFACTEHEELPEELKDNALMYEIQEYTKKTKKHRFVNTSADGRMMGGNQGGNV